MITNSLKNKYELDQMMKPDVYEIRCHNQSNDMIPGRVVRRVEDLSAGQLFQRAHRYILKHFLIQLLVVSTVN